MHLQDTGYLHSPEAKVAEDTFTAFKNGNSEALLALQAGSSFNYLDNEVSRISRSYAPCARPSVRLRVRAIASV